MKALLQKKVGPIYVDALTVERYRDPEDGIVDVITELL